MWRSKSRSNGAGASSLSFLEAGPTPAGAPWSQLCTQGLSVVTFHMAESSREESTHPRSVFRSWLLNLFPKSLQQISHTPKMNPFSFYKTQVDTSPFLGKKSSSSAVIWNARSGWKFMLVMKSVVGSLKDIGLKDNGICILLRICLDLHNGDVSCIAGENLPTWAHMNSACSLQLP